MIEPLSHGQCYQSISEASSQKILADALQQCPWMKIDSAVHGRASISTCCSTYYNDSGVKSLRSGNNLSDRASIKKNTSKVERYSCDHHALTAVVSLVSWFWIPSEISQIKNGHVCV